MFQLSSGMMEFCPVGMPVADEWIIGFFHNSPVEIAPTLHFTGKAVFLPIAIGIQCSILSGLKYYSNILL